jgi:hypothetical protein
MKVFVFWLEIPSLVDRYEQSDILKSEEVGLSEIFVTTYQPWKHGVTSHETVILAVST